MMSGLGIEVLVAVVQVATVGPPQPRSIPVPPALPEKAWTVEELTLPSATFKCDLLAEDGRRGRWEFTVRGGQAYRVESEPKSLVASSTADPLKQAAKEIVPGVKRTRQHIDFGADDLSLFVKPTGEDVSVTDGLGSFVIRMDKPGVRGTPELYRSVQFQRNDPKNPLFAISVRRSIVGNPVALGFCKREAQPQTPLTFK